MTNIMCTTGRPGLRRMCDRPITLTTYGAQAAVAGLAVSRARLTAARVDPRAPRGPPPGVRRPAGRLRPFARAARSSAGRPPSRPRHLVDAPPLPLGEDQQLGVEEAPSSRTSSSSPGSAAARTALNPHCASPDRHVAVTDISRRRRATAARGGRWRGRRPCGRRPVHDCETMPRAARSHSPALSGSVRRRRPAPRGKRAQSPISAHNPTAPAMVCDALSASTMPAGAACLAVTPLSHRTGPTLPRSRAVRSLVPVAVSSLDRHGLSEIPGLVDIDVMQARDVIGKLLQREDCQNWL